MAFESVPVNHESATRGIRPGGKVNGLPSLTLKVESEVMRELRGKGKRGPFDRQHQRRLFEAEQLVRVNGAKWRQLSGFHCRQGDNQHRFGIAKGRWVVQLQVQLVVLGQGQCRNVLVFRAMEIVHQPRHIDNGADIGTVVSAPRHRGRTHRADQIDGGAGGQGSDHRLAVCVI